MNDFRFIIQVSKGLLRGHRARRILMFYDVIVVLVMVFLGSTFLWPWLRERPLYFLIYWTVCAWLTVIALGLAVYDMAKVRLEAREARRQLKKDLVGEKPPDSSHDSHAS